MDVSRDAYKDYADDQESALPQSILRLETHLASVKVPMVGEVSSLDSWTSQSTRVGQVYNFDSLTGEVPNFASRISQSRLVHFLDSLECVQAVDIEMSMAADALDNSQKADPGTFLMFAGRGNSQKITTMLERDPTLITSTNKEKDTALHLAARYGHVDTVKLLVRFILEERKEKLKLSQRMVQLFIPGSRNVVERSEMSVFQQNKHGDTPLHGAAENGHVEVASYLISKKPQASYYYFNKNGISPLGLAVIRGHQGIVHEVFNVLPVTEVSSKMKQIALHVNGSSLVHHVLRARNIGMYSI